MSDKREVFTILEDDATGEGIKLPGRAEGDAAGSNHVPAMVAKDSAGNYKLLEMRDEGDAASGVDALPGLVAKDASGNLAYLRLNADGELIISNDPNGSKKSATAIVTPSAINTLTTVAEVSLAVSKVIEDIQVRGSCFFPTKWELVQVNDVAITVLDSFLTGSGQFTYNMKYDHLEISTGGSGTQKLRLRATQLSGAASDFHGFVEAFQKA